MRTNPQASFDFLGLSAELRVQVYQYAILSGLRYANTDGVIALSETCHLIYQELSDILREPRLKPFIQVTRIPSPNFPFLMSSELTYGIFLHEDANACAEIILQPWWSFRKRRPSDLHSKTYSSAYLRISHLAPALQKVLSLPWSTLTFKYLDTWSGTLSDWEYRRIYIEFKRHIDCNSLLPSMERLVCPIGTRRGRPHWHYEADRAREDEARDLRFAWYDMPQFPFHICWACRSSKQGSAPNITCNWHFVYDTKEGLPEPDHARLCFVRTEDEAAYKAKWSHTLYHFPELFNILIPLGSPTVSAFLIGSMTSL